jgi:hypothetical protein
VGEKAIETGMSQNCIQSTRLEVNKSHTLSDLSIDAVITHFES